jgi:hypothetical protein
MSVFDERYRVVIIEGHHLLIRGTLTGDVLTIINPEPGTAHHPRRRPAGEIDCFDRPSTGL